ncbi:MAG: undecaprenyldiphospho-muramoylpentapeptide beta-N-acetylglucosaminyltransferase [bacterium]|nr:undecaprenyldiphospho-muramoylpentapeptide beta-N-acetylglucosaminyltransferase [bacterium]
MERRAHRIVFAGGGTGGHLYPALAIADELARRHPAARIRFVGARRGLEQRLVPAAGYPLLSLRLSGIKGRGLAARLVAGLGAAWAVLRCVAWMLAERPDLVIGVGGYASGPAVLAAGWLRVKTMVMEQNHFPGATNRWLSRRVDAVCVPSEAARERLGGIGTVTGNPVRAEFHEIAESPGGEVPSLLVFGGSRGARSINRAMSDALAQLASLPVPPFIVHQTGADDEETVRRAYGDYPQDLWEVRAFLDDMPSRLAAADLVVCRAGASTLAELAAAGRPALLVPYPYAADDHQRHNAETFRELGGGLVVLDQELDGERLARSIVELVEDRDRLREMGRAARELALPDATAQIAAIAERLVPTLGEGAAGVS